MAIILLLIYEISVRKMRTWRKNASRRVEMQRLLKRLIVRRPRPPQERCGMARVVKVFTPTRLSTNGMNHVFALPAKAGPHFAVSGGMED